MSGKKRISPGPTIYTGKYWMVEHAYPCKLKGWLVIVAKRHVESLHELTLEEFSELAELSYKTTKLLHNTLKCKKEYLICLAEKRHFKHIHFHVVPRAKGLASELRGTKIFAMLKVDEKDAVPKKEIKEFCKILGKKFNKV